MQDNGKLIATRKIVARDANGLLLAEDSASTGIAISDGGDTTVQGALTVVNNASFSANLTVPSEVTYLKMLQLILLMMPLLSRLQMIQYYSQLLYQEFITTY